MSFFGSGFESNYDLLTDEKEKFVQGGLATKEDVQVYTWGESDYDGLGDALQEGGDELNDETFGESVPVGKDFDFTNRVLPNDDANLEPRREYQDSLLHGKARQAQHASGKSVESIWDDKSPSSVLLGAKTTGRSTGGDKSSLHVADVEPGSRRQRVHPSEQGVLTLQEIEEQMRAKHTRQSHVSSISPAMPEHIPGVIAPAPAVQEHASRNSLFALPPVIPEQKANHTIHTDPVADLQSQPQLTPEEVEHQLRMIHLSQLQHHHAQRREQQQPVYQSTSQHRQQYVRNQEQSPQQLPNIHRSISSTPEPHYSVRQQQIQQSYMTQQQQQLQMQQQLLAQLSQAGVSPDQVHLLGSAQREAIMNEAMRKIVAAERLDQKNRQRVMKMERMARYNDLMTQSDKDFITRIQVSQLVTADPYTEDFYAEVLGSLRRNGTGMRWFGNTGASFGAPGHRHSGRREHAMNRMAEQVYRIVENSKAREKEKGQHGGFNHLQGVLGKTSGRSYKAAPRQLLQVDPTPVASSPASSPKIPGMQTMITETRSRTQEKVSESSSENHPRVPPRVGAKEPLTQRQALAIIERLFDYALEWENNRRLIPEEGTGARQRWEDDQQALEDRMWEGSQVTVPLEARIPHPLVSILQPLKGKKVMRRLARVMDPRQLRITMTLVTRLFRDFDVVQNYHISESLVETRDKHEMEKHIGAFEEFVLDSILPALAISPLPVVSGQLQLLGDPVAISRTRPGIILLTHIFTRAAIIKDRTLALQSSMDVEGFSEDDIATLDDFQHWQARFDDLFEMLAPHFLSLFPSTRVAISLPLGTELPIQTSIALDAADQPVWSFFASMAVPSSMEQQQFLVTQLREKVLENVLSASNGWVVDENERDLKLRNVNIFLHALGLDSSQINL